jgi:hypothetical protein
MKLVASCSTALPFAVCGAPVTVSWLNALPAHDGAGALADVAWSIDTRLAGGKHSGRAAGTMTNAARTTPSVGRRESSNHATKDTPTKTAMRSRSAQFESRAVCFAPPSRLSPTER